MFDSGEFLTVCRKVSDNGFVAATDGNISVRGVNGNYFITRSAIAKGEVTLNDIVEIDSAGRSITGFAKVSTEYKLHLYIYSKRTDIGAVVHAHPPHVTAFAAFRAYSLDVPVFPEVVLSIGRIPLCKYGSPASDTLPNSLAPFIDYANVFVLENHGVVTTGRTLSEAYNRLEKLEHFAHTLYLTRSMGGEKRLSRTYLDKLYASAKDNYGIDIHPKNRY